MTNSQLKNSAGSSYKRIKGFFKGLLIFIGIFAIYLYFLNWNISGIRDICSSLSKGTLITEMRSIIAQYKGRGYWIVESELKDEQDMWQIDIYSTLTGGEAVCHLYHNSNEIVEATTGDRKIPSQKLEMSPDEVGSHKENPKIKT